MKSQVDLLKALLRDAGESFGFDPSRDIVTVENRCRNEGEAFLSVALPRIDDFLLEGFRLGRLPSKLEGYSSRSAYPDFLRDIWCTIFSTDGLLLENPSIEGIRFIRQISRFHKKLFEVCAPDRVQSAIRRFRELDASLPSRAEIRKELDPYAPMVAQILFGRIVGRAISSPFEGKHGPGAVSERYGTNSRWDFPVISYSVASLIGEEFFRPTWESLESRPPAYQTVAARLEAVPKTAEKPRLISIEPSYNQFVQQSLMHKLREELDRENSICSFSSQEFNRQLAHAGSQDGELATLDLSDASDRVAMGLVEELFGFSPEFLRYLRLSRSQFVQLPDDELILLKKFASMGSALTFPVEAMVFTVLVITRICRSMNDFSRQRIISLGKRGHGLSVYGDDIIIPVDFAESVISDLESVGLKVNVSKSFLSGKFRESCGLDSFDGMDVTPVYLRHRIPPNRGEFKGMSSLNAFRNQIWWKHPHWEHTIQYLDKQMLDRGFTYVPEGASTLGIWTVDSDPRIKRRWNTSLQRSEVRVLKPIFSYKEDVASSDGTLMKCLFENRGGLGPLEILELEQAARRARYLAPGRIDDIELDGRPVASKLYYRWVAEE